MSNNALIVFTAKSIELIHQQGGTSSWVLSPASMRDVRYVVCARNTDRTIDEELGHRPEAHGEAFLVGKITGIKHLKFQNNRKRYLVQMSEYAHISVEGFWKGRRNPTQYTDTDTLREHGIDVDKLEWLPMPGTDGVSGVMPSAPKPVDPNVGAGLTIAEAKRGLAVKFGVPEDAIQIVING